MPSPKGDEITPRFPDDSSYFARSILPSHSGETGGGGGNSAPSLNLMRSAVVVARESILAASVESEDMFADHWDVPCMPELKSIPEEGEEDSSSHNSRQPGDYDDEPPTLDPTSMDDGVNETPYMLNASLQEFMPPSNLSHNNDRGGSSSDYYRMHDSFRSISSEAPNSRNYMFQDLNNVSSNLADISSSADFNETFTSPQQEIELMNQPPLQKPSTNNFRSENNNEGKQKSGGRTRTGGSGMKSSPTQNSPDRLPNGSGGGSGGGGLQNNHLRVPESMTFRPPPQKNHKPSSYESVPRTPPKIKKLNFTFLEPPSPIPIRSSIAACQQYSPSESFDDITSSPTTQSRGGGGTNSLKRGGFESAAVASLTNAGALGTTVKASVDKQGLEDFLSVLGQKEIFTELEAVERELAATEIPPLTTLLQSEKQWLVDLNYLAQSIQDENLFAQTMGNLAYISAWEINEKRCDRYSEKLNASLSRHSFDRLSYQVDLWTLNADDRDLIAERINRLVQVRLDIAKNCSDRQWRQELCGNQFSKDIVKMTLIYTRQYKSSLQRYADLNQKLTSDLEDCAAIIASEIATKNSKIEIINRWKDTVSYFSSVYQELQRKEEWLKHNNKSWEDEANQIEKCVCAQNTLLAHESRKSDRLRKIIFTLNVYREKALLIDEWSLTKLYVDSAQGTVKLKLNIGVDLTTNSTNPVLLVDSTLWLHPDALNQNSLNATMRRKVIEARFKHLTVVDTCLMMSNPWELELRLKGGALAFVKAFRIGSKDLVWAEAMDKENLIDENNNKSADKRGSGKSAAAPDDASFSVALFLSLLRILGSALKDMLVTTFRDIRHSASIDDLGGIAWCLSCNVSRLAVEILSLWHEFGAYNSDVLMYTTPPPLTSSNASSRLRLYVHREPEKPPKLTARIPVPVKNKLDVLTMRFDLFAAIHGGGLFAGFEHADKLNVEELANVRSELRRKSRDYCSGCAVSRVAHNIAVTEVISRLIPFMIKRSCSE